MSSLQSQLLFLTDMTQEGDVRDVPNAPDPWDESSYFGKVSWPPQPIEWDVPPEGETASEGK